MNDIILDCDLMRFPNSGLFYYCLNLGNHLQKLSGDEFRVRYYLPTGVNIFKGKESSIVEKSYHKFHKPFMKNCRIWHAPFQSGRIIPDHKKHKNTKVVLTIHDLNPLHEGKSRMEQEKSLRHTQSLIDKSDAVICISEFCKSDVLQHCDLKGKPLHVIHNGTHRVPEPRLSPDSRMPRDPFLFGLGYVNRKKNYHVLLPLVKDTGLELVVAGRLDESDYVNSIRREAENMGIGHKVHLPGPVSEEEKSWYLNHCFAFVHPSLAEGFGAPVVEAMQFGKPLFLSDRTSLPEIGGKEAFYFSSFEGDHMRDVFEKGMKRYKKEKLADAIMQRSRMFDWEVNAKKYVEVYKSLM